MCKSIKRGLGNAVALVFVVLFAQPAFAGNKADSLKGVIQTTQSDTVRLKALNLLFRELYFEGSTDTARKTAIYLKDLTEKLLADASVSNAKIIASIKFQRINAYCDIGKAYLAIGDFPEALKYDTTGLGLAKQLGDKTSLAIAYGDLGSLYTCTGSYPEALKNEYEALKIEQQTNDKHLMASAYTNIGNIYTAESDYENALKNHRACLAVSREIGFKQGTVWAYNNIGGIYEAQGKHDEALAAYDSCLDASKAINYKEGIAASYANLGVIYSERADYDEAIKSQQAAMKIYEEMGSSQYIANSYEYLGQTYLQQKKYDDARDNLEKGLDIALKGGYKEVAKGIYKDMSNVYEALAKQGISPSENWEKAHENYKNYVEFNDSLFNEATRKRSEQAQLQFEFDKKTAAAKAEQDKKDALLAQEGQRQTMIRNFLLAGFIMVLALAFFIFRGYLLKRRANLIISRQKEVVEQKNLIIETKNKAITDSINYAQRIQKAMLPPEEEINNTLQEHFVLYQPKDIVSGDFYWVSSPSLDGESKNKPIASTLESGEAMFLAACDCTGHGVPGAFMSLIGSEKLNEALDRSTDPGTILNILNKNVKTSLHQSDEADSTKDGMDVALCALKPAKEGAGSTLYFSGANRPLWIIRKGYKLVEEVKPTKYSIGGFTSESAVFGTHIRHLDKGDAVYMFTDGYADQFGGEEGKKLTTKKFRELLQDICHKTMKEQKERLKSFLDEWKGSLEQVDDILVIGIRI